MKEAAQPANGRLAENVVRFARALRAAGVRSSPADARLAIEAAVTVGLDRKEDIRAALAATLLCRHEDRLVFDEVFDRFFRSRRLDERLIAILSPRAPPKMPEASPKAATRRAEEALAEARAAETRPAERVEIEIDARLTASHDDLLRSTDFAQMSAAELSEARRAVARLMLPDDRLPTRRFQAAARGRIDPRQTLRRAMRTGGVPLPTFRKRRTDHPPIVILADISGSMSRYSEIVLRFAHALSDRRRHVSTFLFGTRLTNVTRSLARRDPDEAMALCARAAPDWSGGTRIGTALTRFNRDWSRRVLGRRATVILVTDGLEIGAVDELEREAERLAKSCGRLIWLSPLLGFEGFAAKARGVRALLTHVDEFRPVHSIEAIEDLCHTLSGRGGTARIPRDWLGEDAA